MITVLSESELDNCYKHNPQVQYLDTIKICFSFHITIEWRLICVHVMVRREREADFGPCDYLQTQTFPFTDSTISPGATGFSTFIWTKGDRGAEFFPRVRAWTRHGHRAKASWDKQGVVLSLTDMKQAPRTNQVLPLYPGQGQGSWILNRKILWKGRNVHHLCTLTNG